MTAFSTFLPILASAISFICFARNVRNLLIPFRSDGSFCSDNSYLGEDHGGDLLGGERLGLAEVVDLDLGVATLIDDLEGPGLGVLLDGGVIEPAADKTPGKRGSVLVLVRFL